MCQRTGRFVTYQVSYMSGHLFGSRFVEVETNGAMSPSASQRVDSKVRGNMIEPRSHSGPRLKLSAFLMDSPAKLLKYVFCQNVVPQVAPQVTVQLSLVTVHKFFKRTLIPRIAKPQ